MGKQVWRAVVAGGAAAVFTAAAAVPAGAAEGGASFSRVQVNDGKPIVIGTSKEVAIPASFRVVTTRAWKWAPLVDLYRNGADDTLRNAIETNDCPHRVGSCDIEETLYFDPSLWMMRNSEAGAWKVAGQVSFKDGSKDVDATGLTVHVKRNSRLTVNAAPEPVAKGKTITVTGKVTRANWETRKYAVYGGRHVALQFKPSGAASYTTVKKVYANGSGALKTTVKASKTGTWRWAYYGNTTTGASMSPGDHVVVK
ncbi:hypothetical protein ACIQVN_24745 [Streptomyces cyaneofuscatus]|uniref:hypothetical protein n=1 Tax=Streptomyces cyaneofuscatus TaxID=66883 RepID=UPI00382445FA